MTGLFEQHQQRKDEQLQGKIHDLNKKLKSLKQLYDTYPDRYVALQKRIDAKLNQLISSTDLESSVIVHVDMDAFYASVELLDYPPDHPIHQQPVAVGGNSMLSTCNYVARTFGVRSAMPGFKAKELCPQLKTLRPRFDRYREMSEQVMEGVLSQYGTLDRVGMDEAYLYLDLEKFGNEMVNELVERIRGEVFNKTRLTCSAGIAPTRMLAKVCSDQNKPNGQFSLLPCTAQSVREFVTGLRIGKVPGIGKVTEKMLNGIGIENCGQLYEKRVYLEGLFTSKMFDFLLGASVGVSSFMSGFGVDDDQDSERQKSMSVERTFQPALHSLQDMLPVLEDLAGMVMDDIKSDNRGPGKWTQVGLKVKTVQFEVLTRSKRVKGGVQDESDMFEAAGELLKSVMPVSVRLLGVRVSHFESEAQLKSGIERYLKPLNRNDTARCPVCMSVVEMGEDGSIDDAMNHHLDRCRSIVFCCRLFFGAEITTYCDERETKRRQFGKCTERHGRVSSAWQESPEA